MAIVICVRVPAVGIDDKRGIGLNYGRGALSVTAIRGSRPPLLVSVHRLETELGRWVRTSIIEASEAATSDHGQKSSLTSNA